MRLVVYFVRCYPLPSTLMLACLVVAALVETIGISTLLPLLALVTAGADPSGAEPSQLERLARAALRI